MENDPYYALAEEIAAEEGLEIYHSVEDALQVEPLFLIWVVASQNLSRQVLMDFSFKLRQYREMCLWVFSVEKL